MSLTKQTGTRWPSRPVRNTKSMRIELERDHVTELMRLADEHNTTPERLVAQMVRADLIRRGRVS